ncbi:hypothetical protein P885DRAFT_57688 [Corynascus similis CBS 632.67]
MAQQRVSASLWAQLVLRAASVVLLFVMLGYLTYFSAKYDAHLVPYYVVDGILLVTNLAFLTRICPIIFRTKSLPYYAEFGCASFLDIIGIFLAIFGGIYTLIWYTPSPECHIINRLTEV